MECDNKTGHIMILWMLGEKPKGVKGPKIRTTDGGGEDRQKLKQTVPDLKNRTKRNNRQIA